MITIAHYGDYLPDFPIAFSGVQSPINLDKKREQIRTAIGRFKPKPTGAFFVIAPALFEMGIYTRFKMGICIKKSQTSIVFLKNPSQAEYVHHLAPSPEIRRRPPRARKYSLLHRALGSHADQQHERGP